MVLIIYLFIYYFFFFPNFKMNSFKKKNKNNPKSGGAGPSTRFSCGWHDVSRPCSRIGRFPSPLQRTAPTRWNQVRVFSFSLSLRLTFFTSSLTLEITESHDIRIVILIIALFGHRLNWLAKADDILQNEMKQTKKLFRSHNSVCAQVLFLANKGKTTKPKMF